jgi:hypothetical protein
MSVRDIVAKLLSKDDAHGLRLTSPSYRIYLQRCGTEGWYQKAGRSSACSESEKVPNQTARALGIEVPSGLLRHPSKFTSHCAMPAIWLLSGGQADIARTSQIGRS